MALSDSVVSELLEAFRAGDGVDLIRESVRAALQELIEAEATERIGAAPYERADTRVTDRNGHRPRMLSTKAGDVELRIPKLRKGSFFPVILEPRRRIDQALYAVVMEAYVHGVSTRAVDDLVEAMGVEAGISKSEVSRICAGLDEQVGAFRTRSLEHTEFPYVYLDATYLNVRNQTSQVVSMAVVVATGIAADGSREVLGLDVGDSEDETFWRGFLTALKQRGLHGVRLVISDQHAGLVKALKRSFQGAGHQRCRVHFARNLLAHVPKSHADMVAAVFRTIFAQPDRAAVFAAWEEVRDQLVKTFRKSAHRWTPRRPRCWRSPRSPRPTGSRSGRTTRCATRRCVIVRRWKGSAFGSSQRPDEAGGSRAREVPSGGGSSPDNDGTPLVPPDGAGPASETDRCTSAGTSGGTPSSGTPAPTWRIWAGQQCTPQSGRRSRRRTG